MPTTVPVPEDEQHECGACGAEDPFVTVGGSHGEKMCSECHVLPNQSRERVSQHSTPWETFRERRSQYSGFHGPERVKFVGGFARAYDFEKDF